MHTWFQNLKKENIKECGVSHEWVNFRGSISNAKYESCSCREKETCTHNKDATCEIGYQIHADKRPKLSFGLEFSKCYVNEHTVSLGICILFFSLYLNLSSSWLDNIKWYSKWLGEDTTKVMYSWGEGRKSHANPKEFSFSVHDGIVFWRIFMDPYNWDSKTPKWRDNAIDFKKILLGDIQVEDTLLETKPVKIPMAEKEYDAEAKVRVMNHKRRWPLSKQYLRVDIECEEGIPHPGKGTCSYNCADSRTFSLSVVPPSRNGAIEYGIGKMVESVLYCRSNYPI